MPFYITSFQPPATCNPALPSCSKARGCLLNSHFSIRKAAHFLSTCRIDSSQGLSFTHNEGFLCSEEYFHLFVWWLHPSGAWGQRKVSWESYAWDFIVLKLHYTLGNCNLCHIDGGSSVRWEFTARTDLNLTEAVSSGINQLNVFRCTCIISCWLFSDVPAPG